MELTSFYLGTGIALFIALFAWGDQIRKPKEDLKEVEKKYIEDLGLEKKSILPIIRPDSTFLTKMTSSADLYEKGAVDKPEFKLKKPIEELNNFRTKLENCFLFRYFAVFSLTILCFIIGILSIFSFSNTVWFSYKLISINGNKVYFLLLIISIIIIMFNLLITYSIERKFLKKLYEVLDKLS